MKILRIKLEQTVMLDTRLNADRVLVQGTECGFLSWHWIERPADKVAVAAAEFDGYSLDDQIGRAAMFCALVGERPARIWYDGQEVHLIFADGAVSVEPANVVLESTDQ